MAHLITAKKEKSVWRFQVIRERNVRQKTDRVSSSYKWAPIYRSAQHPNFIFLHALFRSCHFRSVALFSILAASKHYAMAIAQYNINYEPTILSFMILFLVSHCVCVPRKNARTFMNHLLFWQWKEDKKNRRALVHLNRTPWIAALSRIHRRHIKEP